MDIAGKDKLYISLKCLDRIRLHLHEQKISVTESLDIFMNDLWKILNGNKRRIALMKADKEIAKLVIDEQDAGFEQSLLNRYYYALSDLILFLKDKSPASVDYVLEEGIEFYRYVAANDYLISLGGDAVILSTADEQKIEADERITAEKEKQIEDKNASGLIRDWSNVLR